MRRLPLTIMLALPLMSAAAQDLPPAGPSADQQLAQARRDTADAARQYKRLQDAVAKAGDEVAQARAQQDAAAAAIAESESRIAEAEAEVRLIDAQAAGLKARLDAQRAPVSGLLAALVSVGRQPPLLALVDGTSSEELVRLKALSDALGPEIQRRTAALSADVGRQQALAASARAVRAKLADNRQMLAARQANFLAMERAASARERGLAAQGIGAADRLLAGRELLVDAERSAQSTSRAQNGAGAIAAEGLMPARPVPGDAALPAADFAYRLPVDARIADGVGSISAMGIVARGVRFETARGAKVVAPGDGTILFAGPFRRRDGVVIIDHGNGRVSVLLGVATTLRKGDRIAIGERLGLATGPLTVEFRDKGRLMSPAFIAASSPPLSNGAQSR